MVSFSYKFSVDRESRILGWGPDLERISGMKCVDTAGRYYGEVHPIITNGQTDAVQEVIKEGRTLELKNYSIRCFCGASKANIVLRPLIVTGRKIVGAEVCVDLFPVCFLSRQLSDSQSLIDIGKASAALAHGVRTPLNAIKGAMVYLTGKYRGDPTFQEFSHIVEEEIDKLDLFLTKFLSSSISEPEISDVDLNVLLDQIVRLLTMQAHAKKVQLVRHNSALPSVRADSFQLEHAILNVVTNSIESMGQGGTVTITGFVNAVGGRYYATIEVADSGRGIDQMDESQWLKRESVERGRGFGLFITHEVVKSMGGYVEITSEKNVGTTVRINIPTA